MRCIAVLAAFALSLIAPRTARADSAKLADAERAIAEVHYDEAQRLLGAALADGGNSPAAVARIYRLSGTAATVLGQRELAEQYYRRWLALEPNAKLDGVAPKLREPFAAAQAYMAAHGRLAAKATRVDATTVDVVLETDPLAMVAAAAGDGAAATFDASHHARVQAAAATVALLDEHGNGLVDLTVGSAGEPARPRVQPPLPTDTSEPGFWKRWTTWAAPAVACTVAGGIFGILAFTAQDRVTKALDHSADHFFTEVDADHRAVVRNATIGIGLGVAALIFAIPTAILYTQQRKPNDLSPPLLVAPFVDGNGGGFAVAGRF